MSGNSVVAKLGKLAAVHRKLADSYDQAYRDALEAAKELGIDMGIEAPEAQVETPAPVAVANEEQTRTERPVERTERSEPRVSRPTPNEDGELPRGAASKAIREYFEQNGLDAKPSEALAYLKSQNIETNTGLISAVKNKMKKDSGNIAHGSSGRRASSDEGLPLPALVQDILRTHRDGLKLGELVEKIMERGYQYRGNKGRSGLMQNVYQAIYGLKQEKEHPGYEGTTPVVLHDETSKRYRLNPEARRAA